jgi:hypothetical protein
MSTETVNYPLDLDSAQTRAWKNEHRQSFSETLEPEEFERFSRLSSEATNNVLAKAYYGHLSIKRRQSTEFDDTVLAAYLTFLDNDDTLEQIANDFEVTELDIQALADNMPDYLGRAVPAVLWNGESMGRKALQQVIRVEDIRTMAELSEPVSEQNPVANVEDRSDSNPEPEEGAEVAKLYETLAAPVAMQVRVFDQQLPTGPELPPYDSEFPFFADEAQLTDEWKQQGQALMAELSVKGVVDGNVLWDHLGLDKQRSKPMNNTFYKVATRFKRHESDTKHLKIGTKSFNTLAGALLQKPAKQSASHLEALELAMVRSIPGAVKDREKARRYAFGIIAELYADELSAEVQTIERKS